MSQMVSSTEVLTRRMLAGSKTKEVQESAGKPMIHIVGPLKLQNELIACFLERETGMECMQAAGFDEAIGTINKDKVRPHLILWDCRGTDPSTFWIEFGVNFKPFQDQCFIALFNVCSDSRIVEKDIVNRGVRGIFYNAVPLGMLSKGVLTILSGELWISRETMSRCLLDRAGSAGFSGDPGATLTSREKEILIEIVSGQSNDKIADHLCLSIHTVKTHIYNIYKKINVTNRLQAVLWAAKNL
ncbi:MAG: response regulator transcription factor [Deltaproteobacteria bacterium]|nr:response regulator transcription factor [Deltaproteobacteria bacterium]